MQSIARPHSVQVGGTFITIVVNDGRRQAEVGSQPRAENCAMTDWGPQAGYGTGWLGCGLVLFQPAVAIVAARRVTAADGTRNGAKGSKGWNHCVVRCVHSQTALPLAAA